GLEGCGRGQIGRRCALPDRDREAGAGDRGRATRDERVGEPLERRRRQDQQICRLPGLEAVGDGADRAIGRGHRMAGRACERGEQLLQRHLRRAGAENLDVGHGGLLALWLVGGSGGKDGRRTYHSVSAPRHLRVRGNLAVAPATKFRHGSASVLWNSSNQPVGRSVIVDETAAETEKAPGPDDAPLRLEEFLPYRLNVLA